MPGTGWLSKGLCFASPGKTKASWGLGFRVKGYVLVGDSGGSGGLGGSGFRVFKG